MACDCEGKEKGAGGPARRAGGNPQLKRRRPAGPSAQALLDLTSLLIVFASDLAVTDDLPAAATEFATNLERFYGDNHGE